MRTEDVAALLVEVGQRVVVPRFRSLGRDEIEEKRPGDLVTVADREAERLLTDALRDASPDALVIGEEATFSDPGAVDGLARAEHAWVIDPVDGTRNFAHGNPDFGMILAEVRHGRTTRGWIWQPMYDAMWIAESGAGATRNSERLPRRPAVAAPPRVAGWRRVRRQSPAGFDLHPTHGACAVDYPALAVGALDALVYGRPKPWDHLAGALLVREVGGEALVGDRRYDADSTGPLLAVGADAGTAATVMRRLGEQPR